MCDGEVRDGEVRDGEVEGQQRKDETKHHVITYVDTGRDSTAKTLHDNYVYVPLFKGSIGLGSEKRKRIPNTIV